MKKNKPMRAAGILLVATMLTTCLTAGTFAKYTTGDSAADSARVAKFGVVVNANGSLFGDAYAATTNDGIINYTEEATVKADTQGTKVVAPGTKNDTGIGINITGTPEVSVQTTVTVADDNETIFLKAGDYGVMVQEGTIPETQFAANTYYTLAGGDYSLAATWNADAVYYTMHDAVNVADDYYPVIFTLSGTGNTAYSAGTTASDSMAGLSAVLTGTNVNKTFAPNTNLNVNTPNGMGLNGSKITWAWAFEQNDGADTILGDLQAANAEGTVVKKSGSVYRAPSDGTDYNLDIKFGFSIAVDQVD